MVGALPGTTIMTKRLAALGYVEAEVVGQNPWLIWGEPFAVMSSITRVSPVRMMLASLTGYAGAKA